MANEEHLAALRQGSAAWSAAWNEWREENPNTRPDLRGANLGAANLRGANLGGANLRGADLSGAYLIRANLSNANLGEADLTCADLREAYLGGANLGEANLTSAFLCGANLSGGAFLRGANLTSAYLGEADLRGAYLGGADLRGAYLDGANLDGAGLIGANLRGANLEEADLGGADLTGADLSGANLNGADLSGANLARAILVKADLTHADLSGCRVYGVSAWDLKLEGAQQRNLVITQDDQSEITVDNLEVAQFIYLLLHNEKIRHVIDTITSKVVLILGRFTLERKAVLDALREELRKSEHDYVPVLFDFDVPANRDITETVSLLARMARFIVADLTEPSSIAKELEAIVPSLAVPVQPLIEGSARPFAMFKDYWKYDWVLPVYRYQGLEALLAVLTEKVVAPAEAKLKTLEERRRTIEAELITPTPFP